MDAGNDLSRCKNGPWLSQAAQTDMTRLHPVFQHRTRMALSSKSNKADAAGSARHDLEQEQQYTQSIDHIHRNYGCHLKTEIIANDVFYTLHELFEFSAASIDQVLELLEGKNRVAPWQNTDSTILSEILIVKFLVDDYRSYIRNVLEMVRARGVPSGRMRQQQNSVKRQIALPASWSFGTSAC